MPFGESKIGKIYIQDENGNTFELAGAPYRISDTALELPLYDQEEIHTNCTVIILSNSVTGQMSIGWIKQEDIIE